jgi:hypothetical protein
MSVDPIQGCRGVYIGSLPSYTYDNGSSGVGATITANSNGAFPSNDGVSYGTGDRILIRAETGTPNQAYNGIYVLTTAGDGSNPWVLTRATDFNTLAAINGQYIFCTKFGNTYPQAIWSNDDVITAIGSDEIDFELKALPMGTSGIIDRQSNGQCTMNAGSYINDNLTTNTQSAADNSTKLSTTAYADRAASNAATDINISFSDVTNNNVSSTKHGFAPKSPADATKFLNGAATPAYAQVKDSDLSISDITTNNASTSAHGFLKKLDNNSAHFMDGTGNWSAPTAPAAAQPQMSVFTASGTLTTSANITSSTRFKFTIIGGGGGGGGCTSNDGGGAAAGGGGAGATCIYEVSGLSPSTGYTITVGAAGTAGAAAGGTGGTGGTSSAVIGATTASANGGAGGVGGTSAITGKAGGAGGTASNGTINITGGDGACSNNSNASAALASGGNGGAGTMGSGGLGGINTTAPVAGKAYGSGGGGAVYATTNVAGAAGAAGIVIVEWFE